MQLHHSRRKRTWRQGVAVLLAAWVACALLTVAQAQEAPADERSQAVAQVALGILSYTRWPETLATVQLCVLGPTEYADGLLKGGKLASGRTVLVRRTHLDDPNLLADCHGVYVGMVTDEDWRQLLVRQAGKPLLSISERKSLCHIGAMFCLNVRGADVGFEVNLDSVARGGVSVNPRVLQLGRRKAGS